MKSQTSNQMEEYISGFVRKGSNFLIVFCTEEYYCPVDFFFFHFHILFGLKPKEEIESECQKVGG